MITLIRLEAEAHDLATLVKDLDAAESAVMALQKRGGPKGRKDAHAAVALNTGVTDEHYERVSGKGETHFKGRRVLRFLGRAGWNADDKAPQPRWGTAFGMSGTAASATSVTTGILPHISGAHVL